LAYTAYKRAWGQCDTELIEVTNKNALYRLQAKYLVERQSKELWAQVLTPDNPHRKVIIDQVVQAALPDSKNVVI
jgi:clathrin heavy chain